MENTLLKLAGVKSLLTDSWRLYKINFAGLLKVSVIPILAIFLISILTGLTAFLVPSKTLALPIVLLLLLLLVVIICVSIWGQVSLLSAVVKLDNGGPVNVKESFRQGWQLLSSFIWIALISVCILIPAFALLVIPGIWLAITLSFTSYALIVENKKGFEAIKASYAYVKGYWFAVAGRIIILGLIAMIPTVILTMPFDKNSATGNIINAIISLLVAPYASLYMYAIYKNLRALKANA